MQLFIWLTTLALATVSFIELSKETVSIIATVWVFLCLTISWHRTHHILDARLFVLISTTLFLFGRIISVVYAENYEEFWNQLYPYQLANNYQSTVLVIISALTALFAGLFAKSCTNNPVVSVQSMPALRFIKENVIFALFLVLAVIQLLINLIKLRDYIYSGYLAGYVEYSSSSLGLLSPFVDCFKVSTILCLATITTVKSAKRVVIVFFAVAIVGLLSGGRGEFLPFALAIFLYYYRFVVCKSPSNWAVLLCLFLTAILMQIVGQYRDSIVNDDISLLTSFLYDQGNSFLAVHFSIYGELVKPYHFWYIFSPIYEPLFTFLRVIEPFSGNSYDYAMSTGNLSHILSYSIQPNEYILGYGVGSSFIAEAYLFGGMIGVVIIAYIIGIIVSKLYMRSRSRLSVLIFLILYPYLIYSARWNLMGFGALILPFFKVSIMYLVNLGFMNLLRGKNTIYR